MKLKSLTSIASTLEEAGYNANQHENAVFVELSHDGKTHAAVLQLQEGALHVTLQLAKISDFDQDQLSLVAINALAANIEMLPYAFAIIKPAEDADDDAVSESPLVLINSVPVEDLSEDELLWDIQKLQSALIAGVGAISAALSISRTA
ncbi:MAG TPA: hypothetical protein VGO90_14465 [Chthoniobacteraceae bacterium]|jgi:hypothetical protein|nr:hypothetical protein [Chthoniobacteraceae bacterium]